LTIRVKVFADDEEQLIDIHVVKVGCPVIRLWYYIYLKYIEHCQLQFRPLTLVVFL